MMEIYIKDLADKLKVSQNTLRAWQQQLDIEVPRDSKNRRKFNDETINLFKKIKELRGKDNGFNTIRKVIEIDSSTSHGYMKEDDSKSTNISTNPHGNMQEVIKKELVEHSEIAEKYAKATYQIGRLEEKVETQNKQIENLEKKVKLLPTPIEHNEIKKENEFLKKEIELIKKENELLKLPWWRKIFNK